MAQLPARVARLPVASGMRSLRTGRCPLMAPQTLCSGVPPIRAVFAAGASAVGAYEVAVSGTQSTTGVLIEEGTVILPTGIVAIGGGAIIVNSGAALSINSSARISGTAGSKVILNGGSLINTNPVNALVNPSPLRSISKLGRAAVQSVIARRSALEQFLFMEEHGCHRRNGHPHQNRAWRVSISRAWPAKYNLYEAGCSRGFVSPRL